MDDLQTLLDHSITQATPFLRGSFEMPEHSLSAAQQSARARHLARRPAASLTYFEGIDVAVIAHDQMRSIGATERTGAG